MSNYSKLFQITSGSKEEILEKIVSGVEKGKVMTVATPNLEMWALARKDEEFLQALREADIRVCDGRGLQLLTQLNIKLFQIISNCFKYFEFECYTGWELSMDLIREAKSRDWRVMLLGGGFGVAKQAAGVITSGSWIQGMRGYEDVVNVTEQEHQEVIEKIKRFKPQVLLVAFGHGKQEKWMRMAKGKLNGRGLVMVGVGGVLDQIVDSSLRPPKMIEKIGLGWLYRVVRQPWRLKRLVKVVF